jgi:ribosomal protein S18 acetylase RimI-like enzyme
MPADVTFRRADEADAACLSALATQVFFETYATSGIRIGLVREADAQFSVAAFSERLNRPESRTTLAERDGHLVAFAEIVLGARHPLVRPGDAAELTRLYVQSPFLRRGIGRRLLAHAEATASAAGTATLWLTAWVGNARALALYASQGYEQLGSTPYAFEGEVFENRLFAKTLVAAPPAR